MDSQLTHKQAGFRPNHSTLDQVEALTENIESFERNLKAGAVFVDLWRSLASRFEPQAPQIHPWQKHRQADHQDDKQPHLQAQLGWQKAEEA